MTNSDHLRQNYKLSTIPRLMERFGYQSETDIDDDTRLTDVLSFMEGQGLQAQEPLFWALARVKDYDTLLK
jgi:hypothetical protein